MVPIKEMTDVLKVVKETANLRPKQWVRLKRGIFKDDLAQIDYIEPSQNQVHVKLIARIDYTRRRGVLRGAKEVKGCCGRLQRKRGGGERWCGRVQIAERQGRGGSCRRRMQRCKERGEGRTVLCKGAKYGGSRLLCYCIQIFMVGL